MENSVNATWQNQSQRSATFQSGIQVELRICLYVAIFVLSVSGNALVALTIAQNRRMRTLTNVLLLNLSIADLLLTMFCMPFTLIPTLLQDFIFGPVVCVLVRYMQGVSVGVSSFTLVTISLERYFAICRPLRSRRWQTLSHSYRMLAAVWACAFVVMIPIAVNQRYRLLVSGAHKCFEEWDSVVLEMVYTACLDLVLLILPLVVMTTTYGLISYKLWPRGGAVEGILGTQSHRRRDAADSQSENSILRVHGKWSPQNIVVDNDDAADDPRTSTWSTPSTSRVRYDVQLSQLRGSSSRSAIDVCQTVDHYGPRDAAELSLGLSGCGAERSVNAKRRVIKMLFVVVAEYFVCWTPMYILQTWLVFDYAGAVRHISAGAMNLVHLLAFASACCHPITYGFMNASFRRGFMAVFCRRKLAGGGGLTGFDDDRVAQSTRRHLTSFVNHEHSMRHIAARNCRVE